MPFQRGNPLPIVGVQNEDAAVLATDSDQVASGVAGQMTGDRWQAVGVRDLAFFKIVHLNGRCPIVGQQQRLPSRMKIGIWHTNAGRGSALRVVQLLSVKYLYGVLLREPPKTVRPLKRLPGLRLQDHLRSTSRRSKSHRQRGPTDLRRRSDRQPPRGRPGG